MEVQSVQLNTPLNNRNGYFVKKNDISYGYVDMSKKFLYEDQKKSEAKKEKILAAIGSATGVSAVMGYLMKTQHTKNPFKLKINKVGRMLSMAAAANVGSILLSSVGDEKEDIKKKWKEGTFQMILTSAPMLLVDTTIKLCERAKSKLINNNVTKLGVSALGVYTGSQIALAVSNKLRDSKDAKKPERKLKLVDMVASLDDLVAMMVLAKIPFADKIQIDKLLPFIYTFCGYRSGTGDRRQS